MNRYERGRAARRACISHWGVACVVCTMDFESMYGAVAKGFIHVHHLRPQSAVGVEHKVDPVADLRPVCPNCHAMLRAGDPPPTIEKLQQRLQRRGAPRRAARTR